MSYPAPSARPYSWAAPELAAEVHVAAPLTPGQCERWRSTGALVLNNLLPPELIQRAKQQTEARYPAPSDAWYPAGFVQPYGVVSPPRGHIRFPMDSGILGALNEITVHERLLTAASQLLGNARHELR